MRRVAAVVVALGIAATGLLLAVPVPPAALVAEGQPDPSPGFAAAMGYEPVPITLAGGAVRLGKPSGVCSTLWGGQPFGFGPACQVHDYGYDLVRHAAAAGEAPPPELRQRVDAMFAGDLHAHCSATRSGLTEFACHALATLSAKAAALNSWRQGHGSPDPEPVGGWLAGAALLAGSGGGALLLWRRLRAPVASLAAAAPPDRDRYMDFLRVASIATVVLGHWLLIVVTRTPDGLAGTNLLAVVPALRPATWLFQVMPIFFFVGGFANLIAWRGVRARGEGFAEYLTRRGLRLVVPVVPFVLVWVAASRLLTSAGMPPEQVAMAARLVAQPLWFFAVYLVTVAAAPLMARLHDRHGARILGILAAGAFAVDVVRFGLDVPAAGVANLVLVWLCVQQLGFAYADGRLLAVRRLPWLMAAGGLAGLGLLVAAGPYPLSMVGLPGAEVSNMSPPTAAILALAAFQIGVVLLLRERAAAWLSRPRPWAAVAAAGSAGMSLLLWHLSAAVVLLGVALAAEVPLPEATTGAWWLQRPLWVAAFAVVLLPVALLSSPLERAHRRSAVAARRGSRLPAVLAAATLVLALPALSTLALVGFAHPAAPVAATGLAVAVLALRGNPRQLDQQATAPDVSGRSGPVRPPPREAAGAPVLR